MQEREKVRRKEKKKEKKIKKERLMIEKK